MVHRWKRILRSVAVLTIATAAVASVGIFVWPQAKSRFWPPPAEPSAAENAANSSELVSGQSGTIRLASGVAGRLGVRTTDAQKANKPISVELPGTLSFDADRLSHVHSRFAGEVVEIGVAQGGRRPLHFGPFPAPTEGQLLAVIWSRDLGEKKSELVDALSQLRLDQENLNRLTQASVEARFPSAPSGNRSEKWNPIRLPSDEKSRTLLVDCRVPAEEIDSLLSRYKSQVLSNTV